MSSPARFFQNRLEEDLSPPLLNQTVDLTDTPWRHDQILNHSTLAHLDHEERMNMIGGHPAHTWAYTDEREEPFYYSTPSNTLFDQSPAFEPLDPTLFTREEQQAYNRLSQEEQEAYFSRQVSSLQAQREALEETLSELQAEAHSHVDQANNGRRSVRSRRGAAMFAPSTSGRRRRSGRHNPGQRQAHYQEQVFELQAQVGSLNNRVMQLERQGNQPVASSSRRSSRSSRRNSHE
ncbi:hypothetical protein CBS101457_002627 [Exobasidium rhododendri]|nr:hypothetical protein CBS101457_002627 [Exobasidium rhododendri]